MRIEISNNTINRLELNTMCEVNKPVCPHNPDIECPCPKDCPRHGKCCACVAHHCNMGNLPRCLRDLAQ